MKLIHSVYVCPNTLKAYGPICLAFKWDISNNGIWEWMEATYPGDAGPRLQIMTDRMIRIQPMRAYFDTLDDAMLFKLTWCNTDD
jgi:hypothetical protein